MSVSLKKGQKISLSKEKAGLSKIGVGLGWDAAPSTGGFFKRTQTIDCDATALALTNGRLAKTEDIIYFGNLSHCTGSIKHMGDNLTGDGSGDDETIYVDLDSLPSEYDRIVILCNIYHAGMKGQNFGMIKNAFIRIYDRSTNEELCRYNLSDDYGDATAVIFGEVYRHNGEWKFNAIGQGTNDKSISEVAKRYS